MDLIYEISCGKDIPDPSPEYEEAYAILEAAGVNTAVIERVCDIVDRLAMDLAEAKDRECPVCAAKAAAEEIARANDQK